MAMLQTTDMGKAASSFMSKTPPEFGPFGGKSKL
jgi:hypothetical protein